MSLRYCQNWFADRDNPCVTTTRPEHIEKRKYHLCSQTHISEDNEQNPVKLGQIVVQNSTTCSLIGKVSAYLFPEIWPLPNPKIDIIIPMLYPPKNAKSKNRPASSLQSLYKHQKRTATGKYDRYTSTLIFLWPQHDFYTGFSMIFAPPQNKETPDLEGIFNLSPRCCKLLSWKSRVL